MVTAAMTPEQFALALRLTESGNDPHAYGDGGLALTSYQVHPAWQWDRAAEFGISPKVGDSWEVWIGALVMKFYEKHSLDVSDAGVAMWFHRGHFVDVTDPDWDQPYADRFSGFANQVTK